MPIASETPGLEWRKREGGVRKPYWVARRDIAKKGYRPKSVPLVYEPNDPMAAKLLASQCFRLQGEMLAWVHRDAAPTEAIFDGKLSTLIRIYETDPRSPYRNTEPETQTGYSNILRLFIARIGTETYLDQLTGYDIKGHYDDIIAEGKSVAYAVLHISILKTVVSYGASRNWPGCAVLRQQLSATKFGGGQRRMQELTYEQIRLLRAEAHRMGWPSAALWLTLQSDLAFRRRDVIGKWVRDERGTDGIRDGIYVWRDGLTWTDIGTDGVLRRLVSKTAKTSAYWAEHAIAEYPDLVAELERIPPERRVGPIVINEDTGLPYTAQQCMRRFRILRAAAGLPDDLQNRDARAGAVTEAISAGASITDTMGMATHARPSTTNRYLKRTLEQSTRAAKLRVKSRKNVV